MNYRTVLNVRDFTDGDGMNISPDHCVEPNRAVITHDDLPNDGCIFSQKQSVPNLGVYPLTDLTIAIIFGFREIYNAGPILKSA